MPRMPVAPAHANMNDIKHNLQYGWTGASKDASGELRVARLSGRQAPARQARGIPVRNR